MFLRPVVTSHHPPCRLRLFLRSLVSLRPIACIWTNSRHRSELAVLFSHTYLLAGPSHSTQPLRAMEGYDCVEFAMPPHSHESQSVPRQHRDVAELEPPPSRLTKEHASPAVLPTVAVSSPSSQTLEFGAVDSDLLEAEGLSEGDGDDYSAIAREILRDGAPIPGLD